MTIYIKNFINSDRESLSGISTNQNTPRYECKSVALLLALDSGWDV